MSKSSRLALIASIVLALSVGATVLFRNGPAEKDHVASLDQWEQRTQRSGFTLLDRAELDDYFICVYDTGSSEIALCYRWKHPQDEPTTHGFIVRDSENRNLQDSRPGNETTELNKDGVTHDKYVDGIVIPIRREYRGEIRLEFRDDFGTEYPVRTVYSKTLEYGGAR